MRVLVTGANGYIGRWVVRALLDRGVQVVAADIRKCAAEGVESFVGDILSVSTEQIKGLGNLDAVIHLAWQDGFNHQADSHIDNLGKHVHFIKNLAAVGCTNVSVMGSMHEIGYYEGCVTADTPCRPMSNYGIAKVALRQCLELMADHGEINLKWLRAFYIMGDDEHNQSIFSKIIAWEKEGRETFPFNSGRNKYDFIHVWDLGRQISNAAVQTDICGIINVCSGKPVQLKDQVDMFLQERRFKIRPEYGKFPDRPYDSPAIWGDNALINRIEGRM